SGSPGLAPHPSRRAGGREGSPRAGLAAARLGLEAARLDQRFDPRVRLSHAPLRACPGAARHVPARGGGRTPVSLARSRRPHAGDERLRRRGIRVRTQASVPAGRFLMGVTESLALGFQVALSAQNLAYCFAGVALGTLIGVLPGIGPLSTIGLLFPITFYLPSIPALIMLAGIYYGAQYGGAITSILLNLPGETSSAVTCLDGYPMARGGRAGAALAISALASFLAGCLGTLLIAVAGPPLGEWALAFGSAEYFSLMLMGLVGSAVLTQGDAVKGLAMVVVGLLIGLIGTDVNSG